MALSLLSQKYTNMWTASGSQESHLKKVVSPTQIKPKDKLAKPQTLCEVRRLSHRADRFKPSSPLPMGEWGVDFLSPSTLRIEPVGYVGCVGAAD